MSIKYLSYLWIVIKFKNVIRYSNALTDIAMTSLDNLISQSILMLPSKWPFKYLEMIDSVSIGQEANEGLDPQPEGVRIPSSRSLSNKKRLLSTPNKRDMHNEKIVW